MLEETYVDIDESSDRYALKNLVPESEAAINLWQKKVAQFIQRSEFWKPSLEMGKKCMNAMQRKIFTPRQRAKYLRTEHKWPVELQLTKKFVNTLTNEIKKAIPGSDITYEDDSPTENAAKPETFNVVITMMKQQLKLDQKNNRVLRNGLITGYPIHLWFEKIRGVSAVQGAIPLIPSVLSWDSTLPNEYFDEDSGVTDLMFLKRMTKAEIYETFPERRKAHERHKELLKSDSGYMNKLLGMDGKVTSRDRKDHLYKMISEARFNSEGGYYFTVQHVFPVSTKQRAWFNPDTYAVFIPPIDWSEERRGGWLDENPDYNVSGMTEVKTLWVTTISSDGFVWENYEHWYQEDGELPCATYIADMVDNTPVGAVEDILPYVLLASVSATEGLDQVRRGTGRLTVISTGSIKNVDNINKELSASEGVLIAKKGFAPKDAVQTFTRTPNTTFLEMEDRLEGKAAEVHGVSDAQMGKTAPRQSEKAKLRELKQGLSPQAPFVENYQQYNIDLENLLCKLIPRVITEEMVVRLKDEYGQQQEPVTVNGTEYDYNGEAHRVVNDIVSARYRAVASIADDSTTSREAQMLSFMELLEAIGNQLFQIDPMLLGHIMAKWPNMFARETSKFLIEFGEKQQQQQQQMAQAELQQDKDKQKQRKDIEMEKIRRPRLALKLSATDVEEAPDGMKILYQMMQNYEAEASEKEMREAAVEQQQQQPEPEEQPEMQEAEVAVA